MNLYHGSEKIVRRPRHGEGNPRNDYGLGFYCTREPELAKEWACAEKDNGFANQYLLNDDNLSCLHLNGEGYHILHWLAILLENRRFDLSSPVSARARQYILDTFLPGLFSPIQSPLRNFAWQCNWGNWGCRSY